MPPQIDTSKVIIGSAIMAIVFFVLGFYLRPVVMPTGAGERAPIIDERPSPPAEEKITAPVKEETTSPAKQETASLRLITPNGGETLCLGNDYNIQWESTGLKIVRLYIRSGLGTIHTIGAFPATFNESNEAGKGLVVWKVGEIAGGTKLPEGYTYTMEINSSDARGSFFDKDTSDGFFIILCEG